MNSKEQVYLQPAFVLHQRPYRNTSAIIEVFSRDYGRFSLIAKGVKRKKSPLKSVLQCFQPLSLSWVRRSELGVLTDAELQKTLIQLDHEALYSGLYLNELIVRLLPTFDPAPDLFDRYLETLMFLSESHVSPNISLRMFEKQVLKSLGYELQLTQETETFESIEPDGYYLYIAEQGFIRTNVERKTNFHFKGEHLLALAANQLEGQETLKAVHRLMHINIKRLLGDKPLKSRELYKAYKRMQ